MGSFIIFDRVKITQRHC